MHGSLNKVLLIGNLGDDPEVRPFEHGKLVRFRIATNESYTNKEGQRIDHTDWHSIVVHRKGLADICELYLRKGHKVFVEGRLKTRSWVDDQGHKHYSTEVHCDEMTMLTGKTDRNPTSGGEENTGDSIS
ncbi:single-stranded DNA-binding protein [bacterium]|nr:single-stranded DNA-binding protein [bacterium]